MAWNSGLTYDNPNLFLEILNIRKQKGQDSIIVVVGQKRTGKSWSAIKLAEVLDRNFNVDEGLYFEPSPFLKYFNTVENKVVIFDEGSESYDSRTWYDIQNKIFNSLLTREGFRRNIIILTLPVLSDLDKRAIRLSTFLITMMGFNKEKEMAFGNVYRLKLFDLQGKTFPMNIQTMRFGKASQKNLEAYEKMKRDWNKVKSDENIELLEMLENPEYSRRKIPYSDLMKMFKVGSIDDDQFTDKMTGLNFSQTDIETLINHVRLEKEEKESKEKEKEALRNLQLDRLKNIPVQRKLPPNWV